MTSTRILWCLLSVMLLAGAASRAAAADGDFAVEGVSLSPNSVQAGDTVTVNTTVRNLGSTAGWVFVVIYMSPDAEITTHDGHLYNSNVFPVEPGQTATNTTTVTIPDVVATGHYYVGGLVKPLNGSDPDTSNNTGAAPLTVSGVTCEVDAYEQDDRVDTAKWIQVNHTQQRNHCDDPTDWVAFSAVAGTTYGIQNQALDDRHFMDLRVYDQSGTTVLAKSPNVGGALNPQVVWTAPASGTYYIESAVAWGFFGVGLNTRYQLTVADALADLQVSGFRREPISGLVGGTESVDFEIVNTGFVDAGTFDVGLYLSTDPVVTREDRRVGYHHFDSLRADNYPSWDRIVAAFPADLASGRYYLAAIVDDRNGVPEYYEDNNTGPVITVDLSAPDCAVDLYEDDDLRDFANPIIVHEPQVHNHCEDPYDWVYVDATGGTEYHVRALNDWGNPDWMRDFIIYDADARQVASGDGVMTWTPEVSGRYHILIQSADPAFAWRSYTFAILEDLPDLTVGTSNTVFSVPRGGVLDGLYHSANNNGYIDSTATTVGYYLSDDEVITPQDQRLGEVALPGIQNGSFATGGGQPMLISAEQPLGNYYVGGYVDPGNVVPEINERNNSDTTPSNLEIIDPLCAPDGYEENDLPSLANAIRPDETQSHNYCEDSHDWLAVNAQQGMTYAIDSLDDGTRVDVRLTVYDQDGTTVLATGERLSPQGDPLRNWVAFTATAGGRYYVLAKNYDTWDRYAPYGLDTPYSIHMATCTLDAFEQDDTIEQAGSIAVGEGQRRNHCEDSVDWVALTLAGAGSYTIATSELAINADTWLRLYDTDGQTILAANDNINRNNPASRLSWNFAQPGTYYIAVHAKSRGADTGYTLSVNPSKGGKK